METNTTANPDAHGNQKNLPKSFPCKVIQDADELPKSSKLWKRSKKFTLIIHDDHLSFNDTAIPYSEIDKASLHIYQSALFLEYGILSVQYRNKLYYFGIKYDDFWKNALPFEVERIKEETPFLLFRKSLIIVIIIYIFWELVKR